MAINKHGLRMHDLRKACGATYDESPYSGWRTELFYNIEAGDVIWYNTYGDNTWHEHWDNPYIIRVCNTKVHMTMQEIADAILEAVERYTNLHPDATIIPA